MEDLALDTFFFNGQAGDNLIRAYIVGEDRIDLSMLYIPFSDLNLSDGLASTVITIDGVADFSIELSNVVPSDLSESDFIL